MIEVKGLFDPITFTITYIVFDVASRDCIIIDPVLDYEPASSKISRESLKKLCEEIRLNALKVHAVLETHAHADHISSAYELKKKFPNIKIGIGAGITKVQQSFVPIYKLENLCPKDGSQFDFLIENDQVLKFGSIQVHALATPGHTPACMSYLVNDYAFTGDSLFMPDMGTGRCDFPLGSAEDLYHSIYEKIYKLKDETKICVGHDYMPGGRKLEFMSTVKREKLDNIQLNFHTKQKEFVEFRNKRDATLTAPRLLLPSIQININAGRLPDFLKIPLWQT